MTEIVLDPQRFRDLVRQVQRATVGDDKAVRKLERISPKAYDRLLEAYGDLGRQAENALIEAVYLQTWGVHKEGNQLAVEGLRRKVDEMREELVSYHSSPLERLLVDRLVCCWIAVCHAETVVADCPDHIASGDDRFAKWLDRCQRRFLMAAKDLATVGKLLGPHIQVNIAEKQQVANVFRADRS